MKKSLWFIAAAWLASAGAALAIPSWMGVYGEFKRHDEQNPGTFTILMNQDYFGLRAEVGIKVNNGAWYTLPMQYAGNVQGNSRWTATPPSPFPAGATVTYYFHGWDHQGGKIWDSRNGANYSFVAPSTGAANTFSVDDGRTMPAIVNSVIRDGVMQALTYDGTALRLAKSSMPTGAWTQLSGAIHQGDLYGTPLIAVRTSHVAVIYADGPGSFRMRYSLNGGTSFGAALPVALGGQPLALNWTPQGELIVAAATGGPGQPFHLFVRRSADRGATWSSLSTITQFAASTLNPSLRIRFDANTQGVYLAYAFEETDSRMFGEGRLYVANSASGLSWASELLGTYDVIRGNTIEFDLLASTDAVFLAAGNTPRTAPQAAGKPRVWRRTGGGWQWADLPEQGTSDRVFVERGPGNTVVFIQSGQYASSSYAFVSDNLGASFGPRQAFSSPSEVGMFRQLFQAHNSGGSVFLTWQGFDPEQGGTFMRLQRGQVLAVDPLATVGPSHHWPVNGELKSGDSLWINTETRPAHAAARVRVVYSMDGQYWNSQELTRHHRDDHRDVWHVNLGSFFSAGETIRYAIEGVGVDGRSVWDNNGGKDYTAEVQGGHRVPVEWIGNTYHWPTSGQIAAHNDVWINTQTWPANTPAEVFVVYSVNGGSWQSTRMNLSGPVGNNDHWHINLGRFGAGTTIRYAMYVSDSFGNIRWDSRNGLDYWATVNR
ncbi:MAG TPA: hypothetical protein PKE26_02115 [Kiritimatiellia bacterium]|nr:hypothetical protein [Kiritimatiellia bacterium]HMO97884.1 hypothetical protein [Kiritimatiellia bacterium]HMP95596.1 hypothetical protein [Kiritimatiellia bacterium]